MWLSDKPINSGKNDQRRQWIYCIAIQKNDRQGKGHIQGAIENISDHLEIQGYPGIYRIILDAEYGAGG